MGRLRSHDGFTLIETLAAMLVFSIVTIGIAPLLASAMKGANISRSITVGKNVTSEAMERVRGLPYFLSYSSVARKADVLDLYYPQYISSGTYVTTCTAGSTDIACPNGIPAGYTVKFEASFVAPGATDADGNETFDIVAAPEGYTWQADPTTKPNKDVPPTRLLLMAIETSWTVGGRPNGDQFEMSTIVGDRKVGDDKVRGVGKVDHVVQVSTTYVESNGVRSELVGTLGSAESAIEVRLMSQATQSINAADFRLTKEASGTTPATLLDSAAGAVSLFGAPPDKAAAPGTTDSPTAADDNALTHPNVLGKVAAFDDSITSGISTSTMKVTTAQELPTAEGKFKVNTDDSGFTMWANNQADTGSDTALKLSPNIDGLNPIFSLRPLASSSKTTDGWTSATTTPLASSPRGKVEAKADARLGEMWLFPVTYRATEPVIKLKNFSSSVTCSSTASASATASAIYSAGLQFLRQNHWSDDVNFPTLESKWKGDGLDSLGYVDVPIGSDKLSDPLAAYSGDKAKNPMVWEDPVSIDSIGSANDIFLFPAIHSETDHNRDVDGDGILADNVAVHQHPGYLTAWHSASTLDVVSSVTSDGTATTARIDEALLISTRPSNPTITETGLVISVGKIGCQAVDDR